MSQPDIVLKLGRFLREPVDTECRAVYLLCEIRKLLDHMNVGSTPLRMFCNWAVHVDLTKPGTVRHLLLQMDKVLTNFLDHPQTRATMGVEDALIKELAYFETFRSELLDFLRTEGLPTEVCESDRRWANFLLAYTGVIEDGSLIGELNWIKKVTFKIDERASTGSHLPFTMIWRVELKKDYRRFPVIEISVSGDENRKMVGWGYSLRN
jgi:hypothetical protein